MDKEHEIEDEMFESLLQDKRHKDLLKRLSDITIAMNANSGRPIVDAINGQVREINLLVDAIKKTPITSQKEIAATANEMCKTIIESNNKLIELLENRLLPDTFTLIKSRSGLTESVKVEYKPANKIK